MTRIALVGAGTIAHQQLPALESLPDVDVVGLVDPESPQLTYRGQSVPVAGSLAELLTLQPDVILVAVPSHRHVDLVLDVLRAGWRGPTLVEKPLATTPAGLQTLQKELVATEAPVGCLYHARFAPEVGWGTSAVVRPQSIRSVEMSFSDPYASDGDADRRAALGGPWLDSGVNLLSVLDHWLPVERLRPERVEPVDGGLSVRIWAGHDEVENGVELWVSWKVTSPSKASRIEFVSGETLVLDHQATAGRLWRGPQLLDSFACDDRIPRLRRHYMQLFESLAARRWRAEPDLDRRLHSALFAIHVE